MLHRDLALHVIVTGPSVRDAPMCDQRRRDRAARDLRSARRQRRLEHDAGLPLPNAAAGKSRASHVRATTRRGALIVLHFHLLQSRGAKALARPLIAAAADWNPVTRPQPSYPMRDPLRESDDAFEVLSDQVSRKLGAALFTGRKNRGFTANACGVDTARCGSPNPDGSRMPNHAESGVEGRLLRHGRTRDETYNTTASTQVVMSSIVSAFISALSGQFAVQIAKISCHEKDR